MAKILVIEDQAPNANLTAFLLEKYGHDVLVAPDAETGLSLARDSLPGLVLMDINLPNMNGIEATRLLKCDPVTSHIPVLALSSKNSDANRRSAIDAGCEVFISKPVNYQEFWSIVNKYLA